MATYHPTTQAQIIMTTNLHFFGTSPLAYHSYPDLINMDHDILEAILENPQKFREAVEMGKSTGKRTTVLVDGTDQHSGKSYLSGEQLPNNLSDGLVEQEKNYRKFLKQAKKGKTVMARLTLNLLKSEIRAKMQDDEKFCADSLPILVEAADELVVQKTKFNGERIFKAFFDELQANQHDWMLFYSLENGQYVWAERTCGILGTLATIYRQRGLYAECDMVMKPYKQILDLYNAMVQARKALKLSDNDELVCARNLTFKYHKIAAYLAPSLSRVTGMIESYRCLIQYEIDTGVSADDNEYAWMLTDILKKPATSKALATTTDAEIMRLVQYIHAQNPPSSVPQPPVLKTDVPKGELWGGSAQLARCAGCQSTEPFLNTYKLCSRCKSVKYCCRECQVSHHKEHKTLCKQIAGDK